MSCGLNFATMPSIPVNTNWASSFRNSCHLQTLASCASPKPCSAPMTSYNFYQNQTFSPCGSPIQSTFPISQYTSHYPTVSNPLSFRFQTTSPFQMIPQCAAPFPTQLSFVKNSNQFLFPSQCNSINSRFY